MNLSFSKSVLLLINSAVYLTLQWQLHIFNISANILQNSKSSQSTSMYVGTCAQGLLGEAF